jgi:SulP family sulfate permease
LGTAVRYIPRPVVIGFTNGIALLIASTQIKDFLGLSIASVPSEFLPRMAALSRDLPSINGSAVTVGLLSLAIILITPRLFPRVPGIIVALVAGTLAAALFHLPVETIGSRFGGIPAGLPPLAIP